jgi:hypothetical protein
MSPGTLQTGDTVNYNSNANEQVQSFGLPFPTPVRKRKAP